MSETVMNKVMLTGASPATVRFPAWPAQDRPGDATALGTPLSIRTLLTLPYTGQGVSYCCDQVLCATSSEADRADLIVPYTKGRQPGVEFRSLLSTRLGTLANRVAPARTRRMAELAFLRSLPARSPGTVAYIWSETSPAFGRELRSRGVTVVREKVNCGKALAKRVLDDAYHRLDLSPHHRITEADIQEERERLALSDAVFCPSGEVESSLRELDLPGTQLLSASYGFDPARLVPRNGPLLKPSEDGPTFLFVGSICVRKGAHLLLRAWARSGVKGRLVLAGGIEDVIETLCATELARPDVLRLPFVQDVGGLYASADAFVFPSLEEGNPLVTNEAAHCGLPMIVSPMGAGRVVRNGIDGFILDPYDADGWVEALRTIAASPGLRERMGGSVRERSRDFTWSRVGEVRRGLLQDLVAG
ncbi:glycosyltransferase family 4 protein [Rubellimicrobium aerolatum]|uniref:Glycosyltransferase family 4 protein n=1 Tax=Rubellimicrobium aerolatum TaxID=490979 RepID=A0ABW0S8Z0_9RHOB|nr:glycosyltransferase family 4 protein [Rubellimicrobium aerolatum]MBP1804751.1 glycosyltransferase involved in cell wall biosynthesis [Rubellimicrobium aerolatum]